MGNKNLSKEALLAAVLVAGAVAMPSVALAQGLKPSVSAGLGISSVTSSRAAFKSKDKLPSLHKVLSTDDDDDDDEETTGDCSIEIPQAMCDGHPIDVSYTVTDVTNEEDIDLDDIHSLPAGTYKVSIDTIQFGYTYDGSYSAVVVVDEAHKVAHPVFKFKKTPTVPVVEIRVADYQNLDKSKKLILVPYGHPDEKIELTDPRHPDVLDPKTALFTATNVPLGSYSVQVDDDSDETVLCSRDFVSVEAPDTSDDPGRGTLLAPLATVSLVPVIEFTVYEGPCTLELVNNATGKVEDTFEVPNFQDKGFETYDHDYFTATLQPKGTGSYTIRTKQMLLNNYFVNPATKVDVTDSEIPHVVIEPTVVPQGIAEFTLDKEKNELTDLASVDVLFNNTQGFKQVISGTVDFAEGKITHLPLPTGLYTYTLKDPELAQKYQLVVENPDVDNMLKIGYKNEKDYKPQKYTFYFKKLSVDTPAPNPSEPGVQPGETPAQPEPGTQPGDQPSNPTVPTDPVQPSDPDTPSPDQPVDPSAPSDAVAPASGAKTDTSAADVKAKVAPVKKDAPATTAKKAETPKTSDASLPVMLVASVSAAMLSLAAATKFVLKRK